MTAENLTPGRFIALIVIKEDGTEVCPIFMGGEDPFSGPLDIEKIRIEGNEHLQKLVDEVGPSSGHRFEELTIAEIYERGYREEPRL